MADKTYDVEQVAAQIGNILNALRAPGDQSQSNQAGDVISNVSTQHAPTLNAPGVAGMSGGGSGPGPTGQNQDNFYVALLQKLGMPVTAANMQFLRAWNQAEGMDSSHFNPFATTQGASGASDINSVGVKSYTSFDQGVQATADTLNNGLYGGILDALRSGTSAMAGADAVANSPWGTGTLIQRVLGGSSAPSADVPSEAVPSMPVPEAPVSSRDSTDVPWELGGSGVG